MNSNVSVAVVDDDPSMCQSVGRVLASKGFEPALYSSAASLLDDIERLRPCCIVADLAMPGITGLELQRRLSTVAPDYPIVFITGRGDVGSSVAAMRGGAVDFLLKPFETDVLLEAVDRAVERGTAARELREEQMRIRDLTEALTSREREVFDRVVQGWLNKQIAVDLGIAEKTVKVHRARVMRKMGVRSIAELARVAENLDGILAN